MRHASLGPGVTFPGELDQTAGWRDCAFWNVVSHRPEPHPTAASHDDATIEACVSGDRDALERVLRKEGPFLERLIARLIGPSADVEDLLQTTFIEAIRAFPRFRREASVRTWLARIAVHVVQNHIRKPERRRKVSLEVVQAEPVLSAPPADAVVDRRRQLERVYHHLEAIGAKNRISFVLHVVEGYSIEEVAGLVGASRTATKSRVFLARRALFARAEKDAVFAEWFESKGGA